MISKIFSTKIGARPIEGSSSRSSLGRAISARADRAHLLLAAGQRAGLLRAPLVEPREQLEDPVHVRLRSSRGRVRWNAPISRFSARSCRGKSRRPSGLCAIPLLTIACGARARDVARPGSGSRPAADGSSPLIARSVVRLAGAVRADQRHDLAGADRERDALERVDRRRSRRGCPPARGRGTGPSWSRSSGRRRFRGTPRSPSGPPGSRAGVPSAIFAPYSSTVMRSRDAHHDLMSCSIRSTVRPFSSRTRRTKAREVRALLRVHPGRRLVEEQQLRLRRERPRDLEPALVAVREGARPARRARRGRPQ